MSSQKRQSSEKYPQKKMADSRQLQAHLQTLINSRGESLWTLDKDYHFVIINDFFARAFFTAYGVKIKPGMHALDILSPELKQFWKPKYDAVLQGEKTIFEFSETFGGYTHIYEVVATPVYSDDEVTGAAIMSKEITELYVTREEKNKIYEKYSSLLENMNDGFVLLDKAWRYVFVNKRAGEILGRKPEDLIGKNVWVEFSEGEGQPFYKNYYKAVETKQQINFEDYYAPWDRWFENRVIPTKDGLAIFFQDITGRKKMETALKKSEKEARANITLLKSILESPEGMNIFSLDTHYRYTSFTLSHKQTMKAIWGVDIALGMNMLDLILEPSDRKKAKKNFDRVLKNGEHFILIESYGDDKLSRKYWENRYSPIFGEKGKVTGVTVFVSDITAKKEAERENLKLSEAVRQSPSIIVITDTEGYIEYVNPVFEKITGYSQEEALGKKPNILKSGFLPEKVFKELWDTITAGKSWQGEFLNKKKSGELYWEQAHISPVFDEHGTIINYLKVAEDINEIKRNEQIQKILYKITNAALVTDNVDKLIATIRKELGTLIDTTNFFVALYDEKTGAFSLPYHKDNYDNFSSLPASAKTITRYVFETGKPLLAGRRKLKALQQAEKIEIYGKAPAVWLGVPLRIGKKIIGAMVVQSYTNERAFNEEDKELLEIVSGQISLVIEKKKTDQELQSLNEELMAQNEEMEAQNEELEALNEEITDTLKKLEEINIELEETKTKVEKSEERYRGIVQSTASCIAVYQAVNDGEDFVFVDFNPMAEKTEKISKKEVLGKRVTEVFPGVKDFGLFEVFQKVWKNGKPQHHPIALYKDNRITGYRENYVYKLSSGEIVAVYQDVTEREQAREKLEFFNKQLEAKNEELTKKIEQIQKMNRELREAKEKAEESNRLKTAFLHNVSHEIRTPMNGILGFVSILKDTPDLEEEQKMKFFNIIEKSSQRLLNTINEIMDISMIESGQVALNLSETDINRQIQLLYDFFKNEAEQKGLSLRINPPLPPEPLKVKTDEQKVYEILMNLIKNAIKYTDEGFVEIGVQPKGKVLEFCVKDSGIGIPESRREAIFDRFVQADISDQRGYEGAGLGLSIAKAYVEMLGGKIWVESEEGKGSRFYFTLPFDTGDNKSKQPANQEYGQDTNTPSRKLKVLIAEDEENSDTYLSVVLRNISKEILHAVNGKEAVTLCRENPDIDLVLMDIKMPLMDGYEATRKIREFNKEVVIMAQTAYAFPEEMKKALAAGCDDYIVKPVNQNELLDKIKRFF